MIIATAGHVDHGKTTLLRAITGIDADRLPEEKRRGMTIDLGYAFLARQNGETLGFIDVPGHEKFLSNMLAGVGGIQHALLVVACDDGIMPQTREHLTILRLLDIPSLTVALTKADRVSDQQIAGLKQQIDSELALSDRQNAAIFITSAATGLGISELRQHLVNLPQASAERRQRFRLAIDRAFTIKGSGLVVTGTALSGQVNVGDSLWLTGSDVPVRVRNLHAQNEPTTTAGAGQRVAINLAGDVSKQQIERGDWLLADRPPAAVERVLAVLIGDKPIHHWQSVHLHHAASHTTGRISLLEQNNANPGKTHLVELVLDKALFLAENDRLIMRDISAKETLAGARVIELRPPRRGKRQPEYLNRLAELSQARADNEALPLRLAEGALSIAEFSWARQLTTTAVQALISERDCLVVGDIALAPKHALSFQDTLLNTLAAFHQQHSDQLGVGRSRLKRMALPSESDGLVFTLIDRLISADKLVNTRGWLHLPEHGLAFNPAQQSVWTAIEPLFKDDPLWVRDIATQTKLDETLVRQTLLKAAQLGLVIAIVKDRYYRSQRIHQFAELIRTMQLTNGKTNAADFRDRLGIGRKLAIQILEFFDRTGFTRRKGNEHLLRDDGLFSN